MVKVLLMILNIIKLYTDECFHILTFYAAFVNTVSQGSENFKKLLLHFLFFLDKRFLKIPCDRSHKGGIFAFEISNLILSMIGMSVTIGLSGSENFKSLLLLQF